MIRFIFALFIFTSSFAFSVSEDPRQTKLYNIVLAFDANFEQCSEAICEISKTHGTGYCNVLSTVKIITAGLTAEGVKLVEKTQCAMNIEEDVPNFPDSH